MILHNCLKTNSKYHTGLLDNIDTIAIDEFFNECGVVFAEKINGLEEDIASNQIIFPILWRITRFYLIGELLHALNGTTAILAPSVNQTNGYS